MAESKNNPDDGKVNKPKGLDPTIHSKEQASRSSASKKKTSSTKSKKDGFSKTLDADVDEYNFAGIKYRTPGKRQRIVVASIVLGLNVLLALSVLLYLKNPGFKDFIFNFAR